jgi:hypothetical protein
MTELGTGINSKVRIATVALAAFAILGTGFDEQAARVENKYDQRFHALDVDKDKRLQLNEYVRHAPTEADILQRDFKLFDLDLDEKLSLGEFKTTPLVTPPEDRHPLPDPMDAYVDHAVAAMDHSFDAWDLHPEREVQA